MENTYRCQRGDGGNESEVELHNCGSFVVLGFDFLCGVVLCCCVWEDADRS
jgi:hypothetical protein